MRSAQHKHRDMARSILPSVSRSSTAKLAAVRRANRREVARLLSVRNGVPDWDDAFDAADPRAYPDHLIGTIVGRRRAADKLNHFERWAVRSTRDLPVEDRLSTMRARLPRGLVGDHALSHLRRLPEIAPWQPPWDLRLRADRARAAARAAADAARRRQLLPVVLETPGAHRLLNRAMKAAAVGDPPRRRTLAGAHDLDAFAADVAACEPWRAALDEFLAGLVTPPR